MLIAAAVGLFTDASWAPAVAVPGAAVSLVVLLLWFTTIPVGGKLGAAFDIGLLVWFPIWG
jgi:hypothetical protein